jgi:hypothetical protein
VLACRRASVDQAADPKPPDQGAGTEQGLSAEFYYRNDRRIAMTECLAAERGPSQVRVNSVSPGYTRTPALQGAIDKGERDVSNLVNNAALGRLVEPVEIARAVAFLAGPDAAAITGVNLPVDCGWLVAGSWNSYGGLRSPGH